jgi:hypothetical protein
MRISASYNFFNGDEHLLPSLTMMRHCVDHISIVWQPVSNAGEPISHGAERALQAAQDAGLVDVVLRYEPDLTLERHQNELAKRVAGLEAARCAGATHFLSLDADEFYRPEEFNKARRLIEENRWTSTSVNTFLHVRRPIWRALDITCCCFITAITDSSEIGVSEFPHPHIDPTRKMTADPHNHHHFNPTVVAMYHMNLVRRDLEQKLRNSSTRDTEFLRQVQQCVQQWDPGSDFDFPNKGKLDVFEVSNEFNTYDE